MSNEKIEGLRALLADESLPLAERKTAAELCIAALVDAVQAPGPDEAEVVELRTPWKGDARTCNFLSDAWKQRNVVYGWHETGPTLSQALKRVAELLRLRALLGVIVDDSAHKLERLAACRALLDEHLDPRNHYRRNNFTAEDLLARVLPAGAYKWTAKGRVPVVRPPQTLADCW